ncbi:MAG: 50S ribosomal protein L17 [Candidatus Magasanikbacteria bacterium]|nr:50S ribosomal protein L17 [Candidatus Magasanikbacteria bacterium]
MRHHSKKITLGREKAQRDALIRGLAESLILHGGIVTTKTKAKALKRYVEPLVSKAKRNRQVDKEGIMKALYTGKAVKRLMQDIAPRYKERSGGYTRTTKLGFRSNDKADIVRVEFI